MLSVEFDKGGVYEGFDKQLVIHDIAGRDQQQFVGLALEQVRVAKVSIFGHHDPPLSQRALIEVTIRGAILLGQVEGVDRIMSPRIQEGGQPPGKMGVNQELQPQSV